MNSVTQGLYYSIPFRNKMLEFRKTIKNEIADGKIVNAMANLFAEIAKNSSRTGSISPDKYVNKIKKENGLDLTFLYYYYFRII